MYDIPNRYFISLYIPFRSSKPMLTMHVCIQSFYLVVILFDVGNAKKNVLFIVADDMRPQLGAYEGPNFPSPISPEMVSPNIDALARRSLLLKRAHVQQAWCSPSRTSLLTGRRPDTTHVLDLWTYWRTAAGNFTTIPQYFKENGYHSISMGKIFHPSADASDSGDPLSWNETPWEAPAQLNGSFWDEFGSQQSWFSVNQSMLDTHGPLADQQISTNAIERLRELGEREQPFFMAVGFHKPHLPFLVPEEFFNLYPEENIELPYNEEPPWDMPYIAWNSEGPLPRYPDIARLNNSFEPFDPLPGDVVRALRRAYYAAVSFTDRQIGRVLDELDRLDLRNNTIVVFWGDHGWQLGEFGLWGKKTNFELSTHAPMMISAPGFTDNGVQTDRLTEFVDLFPTLVELAELPGISICPVNSSMVTLCTEGVSLTPLMNDPTMEWKPRVFSQFPRMDNSMMGYTMRDDRYRYTEWVDYDENIHQPDWDGLLAVELYDHDIDPDENFNIADDPNMLTTVLELSGHLHRGWRASLPPSRSRS